MIGRTDERAGSSAEQLALRPTFYAFTLLNPDVAVPHWRTIDAEHVGLFPYLRDFY